MTGLPPLSLADLDRPVADRLAAVCAARGGRPAVIDAEGVQDYAALAQAARRMARAIAAQTAPGDAVALYLATTRAVPAAMLGALIAGRPYVPLDPGFPPGHLARVLAHSGARAIVCDSRAALATLGPLPPDMAVIAADGLPDDGPVGAPPAPDVAAYVLYTSGSTGEPKGVWQDQRGLIHDVMQYADAVGLGPDDRLSLLYSPSVNGALRDIFGALLTGAVLCMSDLRRDGIARVLEDLRARGVTVLHAMPPVLRAMMRAAAGGGFAPSVRLLYTAGDRFLAQDLADLRARLPKGCAIYTGIGSTECATLYRHWIIPPGWVPDGALVPVGRAIAGREMRLVDDAGAVVAPGEIGQIEVTSPYVARGYWRDPARSAQAFVPCPDRPGWRRFRPGDLARLRPDGLLDFMGRADRQIKLRGYRVEPAEIESALRGMPGVAEAVVFATDEGGRTRLNACIEADGVGQSGAELTGTALRGALAQRLPPHLVPDRVVVMAALPRLGNFKIDMARLHDSLPAHGPDSAAADLPAGYVALWAQALRAPVDPDATLAVLGADSLVLLEVEMQVARAFGKSLRGLFTPQSTPRQLWQVAPPEPQVQQAPPPPSVPQAAPPPPDIIDQLSRLMAASRGRAVDEAGLLRAYNDVGTRLPLIWCFNTAGEADALSLALGPDQPLLAIRSLNGIVAPEARDPACERLVAEACLRNLAAMGLPPVVAVGGNCQAASIAYQLACGLWAAGTVVASLIFMENALPVPYGGRHLILFGVDSQRHNPVHMFHRPVAAWPRYLAQVRRAEIPGAHGSFFRPGNVDGLAGALRAEIDSAQAQEAPPLPRAARRVGIALQADGAGWHVTLTNPGPSPWAEGTVSGLAVKVHLLRAGEEGRPPRMPDISLPLPCAIGPGQAAEVVIPLPPGADAQAPLWLGLCEEGFGWFERLDV